MKRSTAIWCALASAFQSIPATAQDAPEVLSLNLNGRATGMVGEFQRCDGQPCATVADLIALGLVVPPELATSTKPIPLSALPGVRVRIAAAEQVIYIEADNSALQTNDISNQAPTFLAPLSPSSYGAVLNYDMLATVSNAGNTVAGLINIRAFGPYGSFESTANVRVSTAAGADMVANRLDSTYTYSDADRLLRVRVGDVVTGTLTWSRAIRLGGLQISSDFNLRPDLVTYPLPSITSSTVVPATVSLIANGIQQSSAAVQPGPFAVHMLPVISGAGQVSLAVQDELGRQTIITLPFYASSALLRPGLTSFSLDAGVIRENYAAITDHYASWAASASVRHGLTDWLTMEAHGETTAGLGQVGIGATARIGTLGIANFALSGSGSNPKTAMDGRWGGFASLAFQRISRLLSFSANATYNTIGYRDIGVVRGYSLPKATLNVNASYQIRHWGLIGVSFIAQNDYGSAATASHDGISAATSAARYRIVNANYSVNIPSFGAFRIGAYHNMTTRGSYGVSFGMSFLLGRSRTPGSLDSSRDGNQSTYSASFAKNALKPGDLGYRIQYTQGSSMRRSAELEYHSPWARVTGGVEQYSQGTIGQVGMRGSLSLIDSTVFASDHIGDSFGIVRTGGIGNIPVQYENRPIGTTNSNGLLLVPYLIGYQNNRLSLDPSELPPDVVVGQTFTIVRPRGGSGIIVDFSIKKVDAAVVRLHDQRDNPIPMGSLVEMEGTPAQTVGYDGEAYMQELKPTNTLTITQPDGSTCIAIVAYQQIAGDIQTIGPVPCL